MTGQSDLEGKKRAPVFPNREGRLSNGCSITRGATYKKYKKLYPLRVHPPKGPHKIAASGQLVMPKDVLRAAGLSPGDSVYIQAVEDPAGGILIVPVEVAARWFESGRARESERASG